MIMGSIIGCKKETEGVQELLTKMLIRTILLER